MKLRELALTSTFIVATAGVAAAQDSYEFATIDADGDGMVSEAELQGAFDAAGSDADVSAILEAQDTNQDGMISMEEAGADGRIYELEASEEGEGEDSN